MELYTSSTYRTLDVDIIVEGDKALNIVKNFLEQLSSGKQAGHTLFQ